MISLMSEMRNLQMRSKDGLNDEQRRKEAEQLMFKLASMMGIDESGSDDED